MDIIGKCPYFGKPCVKEDCSAFYYEQHCLWDDPDREDYRHFEKVKKPLFIDDTEWYAIGIPYCRSMKIELPVVKKVGKPEPLPMPSEGV